MPTQLTAVIATMLTGKTVGTAVLLGKAPFVIRHIHQAFNAWQFNKRHDHLSSNVSLQNMVKGNAAYYIGRILFGLFLTALIILPVE
ncbi:MAG: hypothetical protein QNI95_04195 [Desulfobacterales bacterium]|nr:hypothetical protein [Desulfobacterales bacterium]